MGQSETAQCADCGGELAGSSPSFCPSCLLSEAQSGETDVSGALLPRGTTRDHLVGTIVGPFEILQLVGAGGMGRVYKARDQRLKRDVALKSLPPGATDASRRRFLAEAQSLSAIEHPNIVTVHDLLTTAEGEFLVMALVRGRTLAEVMAGEAVPLARSVEYAIQIARGLRAAHAQGVVHRDLKPSNIMLNSEGVVKLVDFGLAKLVSAEATVSRATETGTILGTFGYMSPEQARGESVGNASDIFSFGTVLYQLLSGTEPFEGTNPAIVAHRLIATEPPPLGIDVPPHLVKLVSWCLRKNSRQRPESFDPVLRALGAAPESGSTYQAGRPAQVGWTRRSKTFATSAGVVAVLGALLAVQELRSPSSVSSLDNFASPAIGADALYRRGLTRLLRFDQRKSLEQAMQDFRGALDLDPEYAAAAASLAEAELETYVNENRDPAWLDRAFGTANRAVTLDPLLAASHTVLARVLHWQGDLEGAREELQTATGLSPQHPDVLRALGKLEIKEKNWDLAESYLSEAIRLAPQDWRHFSGLVEVLFSLGRFEEAEEVVSDWVAVTPDNVFAFQTLGAIEAMRGDLPGASRSLQRALEIRPEANVYSNLGSVLFMQGRYEESVQAFHRAVEMKPNQRLFWANLGDALRQIPGREDQAVEAFGRAVQQTRDALASSPDDSKLIAKLAECLAKSGKHAEALQTLTQFGFENVGTRPVAWFSALKAYEIAQDRESALDALQEALEAGYPISTIESEPDLLDLRRDHRYHRIVARFD